MEKKYWKGVEELRNDAEFVKLKNNEFAEELPVNILANKLSDSNTAPRRDFLKFLGFSVAVASLASCEAPVRKTIPYLIKPEEITPGVSNWYASTFFDGHDYCSVVVKTREGRPIKLEGNKSSSISKGGVNARVQASVLSLYDSARAKTPLFSGNETSWESIDKNVKEKLDEIVAKNGKIRILSSTIISPSTKKVIADFTAKYPNTKHVTYDAVSYSAMVAANQNSFGKAVIPSYNFNKADVIVAFGADFLANWLSPVEFANQYGQTRKLRGKKTMSRHIQFETTLSVTGSNADKRVAIKPSEQGTILLELYNQLAAFAGKSPITNHQSPITKDIEAVAKELWNNKGKALVVSDANDVAVQTVVNAINTLLESYENTIHLSTPLYLKQGNETEVAELLAEMNKGEVAGLFLYNTNPAYTLPASLAKDFENGIHKVSLKVSFADRLDESASMVDFVCPDHHYLEAWNDAEPKKGHYSLTQPTIAPIFKTRAAQESLLKWAGIDTDYHSYIQAYWKEHLFLTLSPFETFWNKCLQDGVLELKGFFPPDQEISSDVNSVHSPLLGRGVGGEAAAIIAASSKKGDIELVLYEKTGLGNGNQANNPWLQELPDPISKITWDNYLCVSPKFAKDKGYQQGNIVAIEANGVKVEAPVLIQPGQAYSTVALAVGYGRTKAGKAANGVGANAYQLASFANGTVQFAAQSVTLSKTVKDDHEFAATQTHHTMMGRDIVKETTLADYIKNPQAGNAPILIPTKDGNKKVEDVNLWDDHEMPNHHWGLSIDLNSCIGCGSCVIGCQSENNVPVVGKDEVKRSREMHWIRIDRYYTSDADEQDLKGMEVPSENPQVVFQPVMCQHCNHAPCETVCPVMATSHSSEGLNQMVYNRCVGTRYCENNCPYKVRRFNWFKYANNEQFDYNMNDDWGKMVLNPDVVVRARGVMEKCSLCVQRIQEGKLNAKKDNRKVKDGEIQSACAQSCPTNAIVFGDFNDPNSEIAKLAKDERNYHLLGELDTQPNVFYQTKVRNTN